jgi:hypothetical protein
MRLPIPEPPIVLPDAPPSICTPTELARAAMPVVPMKFPEIRLPWPERPIMLPEAPPSISTPMALARALVPVEAVPRKLLSTTLLLVPLPVSRTPTPELPEMVLPA